MLTAVPLCLGKKFVFSSVNPHVRIPIIKEVLELLCQAGLGRLVTLSGNSLELGESYVFPEFRGKGIARNIVDFLLGHIQKDQTVYCIPFTHLVPFYEQCGFAPCQDIQQAPQEVRDKFSWCEAKYANPTSLLMLTSRRQCPNPRSPG